MSAIDHSVIERILADIHSTLGAAESHGLLCGLLCVSPTQRAKARWFSELLDSASLESGQLETHTQSLQALDALFESSVSAINSADMDFSLLMPDENDSISTRTEALASWCSGFCAGIGFGTTDQRKMPDDTRELLTDFTAISRADPESGPEVDPAVDPEESDSESALVELVEYVRMGVLLVNEELQPAPHPPSRVH